MKVRLEIDERTNLKNDVLYFFTSVRFLSVYDSIKFITLKFPFHTKYVVYAIVSSSRARIVYIFSACCGIEIRSSDARCRRIILASSDTS